MRNLRMKIAAFALALGLGGLGGYAISSSKDRQPTSGVVAEGTKVVRRTVHAKKPKPNAKHLARARSAAHHAPASTSEPVSTGSSGSGSSSGSSSAPVHTRSSGSSGGGSSQPPVSTGSSGAGGGGGVTGGGEDGGGGEHEVGDD